MRLHGSGSPSSEEWGRSSSRRSPVAGGTGTIEEGEEKLLRGEDTEDEGLVQRAVTTPGQADKELERLDVVHELRVPCGLPAADQLRLLKLGVRSELLDKFRPVRLALLSEEQMENRLGSNPLPEHLDHKDLVPMHPVPSMGHDRTKKSQVLGHETATSRALALLPLILLLAANGAPQPATTTATLATTVSSSSSSSSSSLFL